MPKNNPEQIRKKLYEEYEDSLFKLIMHDVAEKEGKLFLEEKEKLKNAVEFLPSAEAFKRFSQQLDAHLKKPLTYARTQRIFKALNRFAVAMLIVIVLSSIAVTSVEALKVRVLNLLMDIQPEYTSLELKDNGSDSGSLIINCHKAYIPTYIPAGFKVSAISNGKLLRKIEFKNQQGSFITYTELSEGSKPALDTENASIFETVDINGHEGTLVVKDSLVTIIWGMNNRMFVIRAQTGKDTAIKVAEGVEYID
ncbi:DUF4367 domain-containing protein [Desulfoscipio sp. XC116]|uniref:DUF4367 domain-containing protein n=1 Tax=Desulfoscipio sp. XC116 TaxID=3144975 RepID=UPI00325AEF1A